MPPKSATTNTTTTVAPEVGEGVEARTKAEKESISSSLSRTQSPPRGLKGRRHHRATATNNRSRRSRTSQSDTTDIASSTTSNNASANNNNNNNNNNKNAVAATNAPTTSTTPPSADPLLAKRIKEKTANRKDKNNAGEKKEEKVKMTKEMMMMKKKKKITKNRLRRRGGLPHPGRLPSSSSPSKQPQQRHRRRVMRLRSGKGKVVSSIKKTTNRSTTVLLKRRRTTTPTTTASSSASSSAVAPPEVLISDAMVSMLWTCGKDIGSLVFPDAEANTSTGARGSLPPPPALLTPSQPLTEEVAARRVQQLLDPLEQLIREVENGRRAPRDALRLLLAILRAGLRQPIDERPHLLTLSSADHPLGLNSMRIERRQGSSSLSSARQKTKAKEAAVAAGKDRGEQDSGQQQPETEQQALQRQVSEALRIPPEAVAHLPPSQRPHNVAYHRLVSSRAVPLAAMIEGLHTIAYTSVKLRVELLCLLLRAALEEEMRRLTTLTNRKHQQEQQQQQQQQHHHHHASSRLSGGRGNSSSSSGTGEAEAVAVAAAPIDTTSLEPAEEDSMASLLITETLLHDFVTYYTNVVRYFSMTRALHVTTPRMSVKEGGRSAAERGATGALLPLSSSSSSSSLPSSPAVSHSAVSVPLQPSTVGVAAHPSADVMEATLFRQYYELTDWILLVETTATVPAITLSQITRAEWLEQGSGTGVPISSSSSSSPLSTASREGVLLLELRRPSTSTPWGVLFTETGKLLDVDVSMRISTRAQQVHELLQRTGGGARILSVNGQRVKGPPNLLRQRVAALKMKSLRKKSQGGRSAIAVAAKRLAARYYQYVLRTIHEATVGYRRMVLELSSPAFSASAMRERAKELLFYVPFQGGEAAAGQRACFVFHRPNTTGISWSFAIEQKFFPPPPPSPSSSAAAAAPIATAENGREGSVSSGAGAAVAPPETPPQVPYLLWHPPQPGAPGAAVLSDAGRRFVQAFRGRLRLRAVNGVEVSVLGQAAALMKPANSVLLQLEVLPATVQSSTTSSSSSRSRSATGKPTANATAAIPSSEGTTTRAVLLPGLPALGDLARSAIETRQTSHATSTRSQSHKNKMKNKMKKNTHKKNTTTTTTTTTSSSTSRRTSSLNTIKNTTKRKEKEVGQGESTLGQQKTTPAGDESPTTDATTNTASITAPDNVKAVSIKGKSKVEPKSSKPPASELAVLKEEGENKGKGKKGSTTTTTTTKKEEEEKQRKKTASPKRKPSRGATADDDNSSSNKSGNNKDGRRSGSASGKGSGSKEKGVTTRKKPISSSSSSTTTTFTTDVTAADDVMTALMDPEERTNTTPGQPDLHTNSTSSRVPPCVFANNVRLVSLSNREIVLERPSTSVPWGLPVEKNEEARSNKRQQKKGGKQHASSTLQGGASAPLQLAQLPPLPMSRTPTPTGKRNGKKASGNGEMPQHPYIQQFNAMGHWPIETINGVRAKDANKAIDLMRSLTRMTLRFLR